MLSNSIIAYRSYVIFYLTHLVCVEGRELFYHPIITSFSRFILHLYPRAQDLTLVKGMVKIFVLFKCARNCLWSLPVVQNSFTEHLIQMCLCHKSGVLCRTSVGILENRQ